MVVQCQESYAGDGVEDVTGPRQQAKTGRQELDAPSRASKQ